MNTTGNTLVPFDLARLEEVIALDQRFFYRPWSTLEWVDLNWNTHDLCLWGNETQLKGFGLFTFLTGDEAAHLLKILLVPDEQGTGQATEFLLEMCNHLRKKNVSRIFLEVEKTNFRAISFYQKSGFKQLRLIRKFYSDGSDALTMDLAL
jgi:[ribosomal protein S18]-alanine N-acetyltransferase